MSVLITGVNMPSFGEGNELIVRVLPNGAVRDEHGICLNAKAVPVPPHGRLGDLDELLDRAFGCLDEETFLAFQFLVNGSVAIIPAEPPKKEE